jgi:hypothetical protein
LYAFPGSAWERGGFQETPRMDAGAVHQTLGELVEALRQFLIQNLALRAKCQPSLSDADLFGHHPGVHSAHNNPQIVEGFAVGLSA